MRFIYLRVSTDTQTEAAQLEQIGTITKEDKVFCDHGVSGSVRAEDRKEFGRLLDQIRDKDRLVVAAVDRLGRNAANVMSVVETLINKGVTIEIKGLGIVSSDQNDLVSRLLINVLSSVAEMERSKIRERTAAGRQAARESIKRTGKTHRGATSLGRKKSHDAKVVAMWRESQKASLSETARRFKITPRTVARYMKEAEMADKTKSATA